MTRLIGLRSYGLLLLRLVMPIFSIDKEKNCLLLCKQFICIFSKSVLIDMAICKQNVTLPFSIPGWIRGYKKWYVLFTNLQRISCSFFLQKCNSLQFLVYYLFVKSNRFVEYIFGHDTVIHSLFLVTLQKISSKRFEEVRATE